MARRMRGLTNFIAEVRNCANHEAEVQRVEKELTKIRVKFADATKLKPYDRRKYVWKLIYIFMLGYDVDFGQMEAVKLISSSKFSEKKTGYLAISFFLVDQPEILRMTANQLKTDMYSENKHVAAVALNCIANVGEEELAEHLMRDITRLTSPQADEIGPSTKRRAYLALTRLFRRDTDLINAEMWAPRIAAAMGVETDIGILTAISSFTGALLEECEGEEIESYREVFAPILTLLFKLMQGEVPSAYVWYTIPAPWLMTKLLRLLQFFPVPRDLTNLAKLNQITQRILAKPLVTVPPPPGGAQRKKETRVEKQKRAYLQNQSNTEHAVLLEGLNLLVHLGESAHNDTVLYAARGLEGLVKHPEVNIRCLALDSIARLSSIPQISQALKKNVKTILGFLEEADVTVRRQALNVLFALCDKNNWAEILDKMLECLKQKDILLQEELVLKIAILAERNAPDLSWYVDVVFKMLEYAPDSVSDDIWHRVVQVVTGFDEQEGGRGTVDAATEALQAYAAKKAFEGLDREFAHETLCKLSAYLLGEFGQHIREEVDGDTQLTVLLRHFPRLESGGKALILLAAAKMFNSHDGISDRVLELLEEHQRSLDVEVQQRGCELSALCSLHDDVVENVLGLMPPFADSIQENNPLMRRLKSHKKSRALGRSQLEELAQTEGTLMRPSLATAGRAAEGGEDLEEDEAGGVARYRAAAAAAAADRGGGGGGGGGGESSSDGEGEEESEEEEEDGRRGHAQLQEEEESSLDSDEGSEEGEDEEDEPPVPTFPPPSPTDASSMWRYSCVSKAGPLFVSPSLCLNVKGDYRGPQGRLAVQFVNKTPMQSAGAAGALQVQSVSVEEIPQMRSKMESPPQTLHAGESAVLTVDLLCLQPYLNPPKLIVAVVVPSPQGPQARQVALSLPSPLTKFVSPAKLSAPSFIKYWKEMSASGCALAGPLAVKEADLPGYVVHAFNLHSPAGKELGASICGSGSFHTGTPVPGQADKKVTVASMVKLDVEKSRKLIRVGVHAAHPKVASALAQVIASYLIEPGKAVPVLGQGQGGPQQQQLPPQGNGRVQ